ncbi:MAG: gamma-glutamyl-gamma-aminobutyrate hydrolase family protein, partial [Spirochaetaceae bacterium]|nr:gamma-glutamyl-gamma-aminobutyrate hydrolase family protein [Spirochaetaceae bacterium]
MGMGKTMKPSGGVFEKAKPPIAVTGEEVVEPLSGSQVFVLSRRYGSAVARAGGLPLMPGDVRLAGDYAEITGALILTEGPAVHRGRYGKYYRSCEEMRELSITRDAFEVSLVVRDATPRTRGTQPPGCGGRNPTVVRDATPRLRGTQPHGCGGRNPTVAGDATPRVGGTLPQGGGGRDGTGGGDGR